MRPRRSRGAGVRARQTDRARLLPAPAARPRPRATPGETWPCRAASGMSARLGAATALRIERPAGRSARRDRGRDRASRSAGKARSPPVPMKAANVGFGKGTWVFVVEARERDVPIAQLGEARAEEDRGDVEPRGQQRDRRKPFEAGDRPLAEAPQPAGGLDGEAVVALHRRFLVIAAVAIAVAIAIAVAVAVAVRGVGVDARSPCPRRPIVSRRARRPRLSSTRRAAPSPTRTRSRNSRQHRPVRCPDSVQRRGLA